MCCLQQTSGAAAPHLLAQLRTLTRSACVAPLPRLHSGTQEAAREVMVIRAQIPRMRTDLDGLAATCGVLALALKGYRDRCGELWRRVLASRHFTVHVDGPSV